MFMKSFLSGKICLTFVTIQKIQSFWMRLIRKLLVKWRVIVVEFVQLKSKMYSMKKTDGEDYTTAKDKETKMKMKIYLMKNLLEKK